jgi:hypothetical protein
MRGMLTHRFSIRYDDKQQRIYHLGHRIEQRSSEKG